MCYIVDTDTSYNLLLGRLWIHRNFIISSALHQGLKYANEEGGIRILIAEKHPLKRIENYFTYSLLYQDLLEVAKNPPPEDPDSGNEANAEPEPDKEYLLELNLL